MTPYYSRRQYVLSQEAIRCLERLHQHGYGTKSRIVNRAIQVYYLTKFSEEAEREEE
ncbi:hypothetical protein [Candidatus Methanomassiliicoccus intestinalis]|uniref:hypothetical protein n=1 Tax=Candidatus Methanomassiliicoccus intestinalis TaxID=1406512 RepID=UPI0037DCB464